MAPSQTLTFAGRPMEALNSIHKAIELDPGHPSWFPTYLAEAYYAAGKSREAVDELAKINQPPFRDLRAASHASLGQLEEARLAVAGLQNWNSSVSLAKIRYVFPYRPMTIGSVCWMTCAKHRCPKDKPKRYRKAKPRLLAGASP
jgi:predicted Zn-dependent protease